MRKGKTAKRERRKNALAYLNSRISDLQNSAAYWCGTGLRLNTQIAEGKLNKAIQEKATLLHLLGL